MDSIKKNFLVIDAGIMAYQPAWDLQQQLHLACVQERLAGAIIFLQHPPVITLGKNAEQRFVLMAPEALRERGVDIVAVDRGGEATAHMLGQLVVYPIIPIAARGLTVRSYVDALESAIIATLGELGISAFTDPDYPGVWCGNDKICALGVRIKQRVSMHGLALNVSNSFELFEAIVPCGILGRGVTSIENQLHRAFDVQEVQKMILSHLLKSLSVNDFVRFPIEDLPKLGFGNTIRA